MLCCIWKDPKALHIFKERGWFHGYGINLKSARRNITFMGTSDCMILPELFTQPSLTGAFAQIIDYDFLQTQLICLD